MMSSQRKSVNYLSGDGRTLNIEEIADIYRQCVNLATPTTGSIQRLAENDYSLTCSFNTTDCDKLESIKTSKAYSLRLKKDGAEHRIENVRCITQHQGTDERVATSNNGRYLARLMSSTSQSDADTSDPKQLLELWDRSRLLKTIQLSDIDAHGPISTDPVFTNISWYPFGDQNKLVYVCREKIKKFQSFFNSTEVFNQECPQGKQINLGDEHTRESDWGECLTGTIHTLVAVLDMANDFKITTLDEEGFSLAETRWLNGMRTVSIAYPEEPRRVGLVYCNSRPSKIVVHDWSQGKPSEVFTLKSDTHCFSSPRVENSGQRFVYFKNPIWGPHEHSRRMHIHDLNTNQDIELVDKSSGERDMFVKISNNCFSQDDKNILLLKHDHLYNHMCLFNLEEFKFKIIKFPTTGMEILDFKHNVILAKGSEINATPTLYVAALSFIDPGELVEWHQIEDCIHLNEVEYEPYTIPTGDGTSFISSVLVSPCLDMIQRLGDSKLLHNQAELPTIVMMHGGPHSNFIVEYLPSYIFYARLGLQILIVNYRGSTGVSEDYIKSLCGKIGQIDVDDCMHAIRHFVEKKLIDPKKLIIQGGSHGGFLASHLSCQEEFKFLSAIIRNPVTDLSSLHVTSDIPDWCYAEGLNQKNFDPSWLPSSDELVGLYECSPIAKFKKANVPTLMLLGSKDRRVPMFQGERWFELLKARGIKTQCKVYDDKHALSKPDVSADAIISAAIWILSNL